MKLVMAVSKDGYVQRTKDDDMSWTGPWDKAAFKLLTMTCGGVMACGKNTARLMPQRLPGRTLKVLERRDSFLGSNDRYSLYEFQRDHPDGWLIGGMTVATQAFILDYIDEAHICVSDRYAYPALGDNGAQSGLDLSIWLTDVREGLKPPRFLKAGETKVGDCTVHHWRRVR